MRRLRWSPNRIVVEVDARRPTSVLVNQNYGPGWRAEGGTLADEGGLLAAGVPAGKSMVTSPTVHRASSPARRARAGGCGRGRAGAARQHQH